MPSLDSPLVVLGAYWIAGNNRRGRKFTGGESGKGLVAGGVGAANAQWVGEQVQGTLGADALTSQLAQALGGAGVSWAGSRMEEPMLNAAARGIHYNVAQQAASDLGLKAGEVINDGSNGDTQAMQATRSGTRRSTGTTF